MRCLWPPSCTLAGIRQQISCRTWTTHHELRAAAFSFGTLHVTRPAVLQVVWMSNWLERASTFFPEPLTFLQQGPDLWVVSIGAAATHTINLSGIVVPAANTYRESFCKCHQTKSWFTCSFHLLKNIKQLAVLFRGWASASLSKEPASSHCGGALLRCYVVSAHKSLVCCRTCMWQQNLSY